MYEELNDYLPQGKKKAQFSLPFKNQATVLDAIRYLEIPPEEVDLVLINGDSADFGWILCDGDRVSIYPIFESLDISELTRLREKPLIKLKKSWKHIGNRDVLNCRTIKQ